MKSFNRPVCELGGFPGADARFRLRMIERDAVRTKAPNFYSTPRVAESTARTIFGESKNMPFIWSIL
jgi:hypothetical protein